MERRTVVDLQIDVERAGNLPWVKQRIDGAIGETVGRGHVALQRLQVNRLPIHQRRYLRPNNGSRMMRRADDPDPPKRRFMDDDLHDTASEQLVGLHRHVDERGIIPLGRIGILQGLLRGDDVDVGPPRPEIRIDQPLDLGTRQLGRPGNVDRFDRERIGRVLWLGRYLSPGRRHRATRRADTERDGTRHDRQARAVTPANRRYPFPGGIQHSASSDQTSRDPIARLPVGLGAAHSATRELPHTDSRPDAALMLEASVLARRLVELPKSIYTFPTAFFRGDTSRTVSWQKYLIVRLKNCCKMQWSLPKHQSRDCVISIERG